MTYSVVQSEYAEILRRCWRQKLLCDNLKPSLTLWPWYNLSLFGFPESSRFLSFFYYFWQGSTLYSFFFNLRTKPNIFMSRMGASLSIYMVKCTHMSINYFFIFSSIFLAFFIASSYGRTFIDFVFQKRDTFADECVHYQCID